MMVGKTWGFTRKASLYPRLYAIATLRVLKPKAKNDGLDQSVLIRVSFSLPTEI